uniref:NADH dehydrogenase subunit 4 n=1 Tax=Scolytoplatypus wugongshanensis TaxID=2894162 RepID=UPI0023AB3159|nr:NADH dehydrogenase subunit 4 [Scolytoplatypus wugongshanensis]WCB99743.1 NADH dehydrogenase subunit 4 [Scolytoplatypus wugongshanensis]
MMMILGLLFSMMMIWVDFWLVSFYLVMMMMVYLMQLNLSGGVENIFYSFGADKVSYLMISLSVWVSLLMIMASESLYKSKMFYKLFLLMVLLMLVSLILTFMSLNIFLFYLFFEISLIPIFFLIMGWGAQPERIMAGVYLMFYTLILSIPMMMVLFYMYNMVYSMDFYFLLQCNYLVSYLCLNMVFFVKIPMYLIHLWLPKAHVEAPIAGSMILAGVMLKLGGYGLMRVLKIFLLINKSLNYMIITVSLLGGAIISIMCFRQSDMKMLIAYSSVSHMGMALAGIVSLNIMGYQGGLMMMLAHGLSSSGMFCLANIIYERSFSRSIYLNKGIMNILPNLSLWWFLISSSSMSAPLSLNLISEISLINSLVTYSWYSMGFIFIMVLFSAVYTLFLYSYTQHGKVILSGFYFDTLYFREYLLFFLHWLPLNLIFMKLDIFNL